MERREDVLGKHVLLDSLLIFICPILGRLHDLLNDLRTILRHMSKYLSGNNLPRIILIRDKLFPDRYLYPIPVC